jgi:hypothetical protein
MVDKRNGGSENPSSNTNSTRGMDRRSFLKGAGKAVTGLIAGGVLSTVTAGCGPSHRHSANVAGCGPSGGPSACGPSGGPSGCAPSGCGPSGGPSGCAPSGCGPSGGPSACGPVACSP